MHPEPESTPDEDENENTGDTRTHVPGRPTIHDKTTPPTERTHEYGCPFCPYTAPNQRLVRLHITRETDSTHQNRNAFLDPIHIHALDADGDLVETLDAPGTTQYEGEDATQLLPAGIDPDTKKADIIAAAITNPTATPQDIHQTVYGEPSDSPSYVYKVLEDELTPQITQLRDATDGGDDTVQWRDLTSKQQAVLIEHLRDPDRTDTAIQDAAGVAAGYISTTGIFERYERLIQHLRAKLEAGTITLDELEDRSDLVVGPSPTAGPGEVAIPREKLDGFLAALEAREQMAREYQEAAPTDSAMQAAATIHRNLVQDLREELQDLLDVD